MFKKNNTQAHNQIQFIGLQGGSVYAQSSSFSSTLERHSDFILTQGSLKENSRSSYDKPDADKIPSQVHWNV